MTQFTEAFYPAYQGTRKAIEEKRDLCSKIPAGLTAEYAKLIQLQGEIMQLYERLVQLEALWGVYCVNYTADVNTQHGRFFIESESLKELAIIMEQK